jgi:hypothetical protein
LNQFINFKKGDKQFYLLFWFLQFCAVGLSSFAHACGFLVTADSIEYLAAAESFRENTQLLGSDGTPFVYWPPLFPLLLSLFENPLIGLFWINTFCQLLAGLIIYELATRELKNFTISIVFVMLGMFSVHLMMATVFVWSDLIFVCLALCNFYSTYKLLHNRTYWVLFLLSGFLMCLQRNAGIFWIAPTCAWLCWYLTYNLKKRIMISIAAFLVMTAGFWYWNFNHPRQITIGLNKLSMETGTQVMNNLYLIGIALGKLFSPITGAISFFIFVTISAASLYVLRVRLAYHKHLQLIGFIGIVYVLCLSLYDNLDSNDLDRYLLPLVPIILLFVGLALEDKSKQLSNQKQIIVRGLLILWMSYPLMRTISNVFLWHDMSC